MSVTVTLSQYNDFKKISWLVNLIVIKKHTTKYNDSDRRKSFSNYTVKTASIANRPFTHLTLE